MRPLQGRLKNIAPYNEKEEDPEVLPAIYHFQALSSNIIMVHHHDHHNIIIITNHHDDCKFLSMSSLYTYHEMRPTPFCRSHIKSLLKKRTIFFSSNRKVSNSWASYCKVNDYCNNFLRIHPSVLDQRPSIAMGTTT